MLISLASSPSSNVSNIYGNVIVIILNAFKTYKCLAIRMSMCLEVFVFTFVVVLVYYSSHNITTTATTTIITITIAMTSKYHLNLFIALIQTATTDNEEI